MSSQLAVVALESGYWGEIAGQLGSQGILLDWPEGQGGKDQGANFPHLEMASVQRIIPSLGQAGQLV